MTKTRIAPPGSKRIAGHLPTTADDLRVACRHLTGRAHLMVGSAENSQVFGDVALAEAQMAEAQALFRAVNWIAENGKLG